ncbi:hypothetical protein BH09ACT8_BH09ACT8_58560 [soil metagenome]
MPTHVGVRRAPWWRVGYTEVESAAPARVRLGLNLIMIAGLVIVGLSAHSLGLLAAAGDFAADSMGALILGLVAVTIRDGSDRPGASRATTGMALIIGAALLAVSVLVVVEAVRRLLAGASAVQGLPMLMVSVVSTVVMLVGALILGLGAGSEDLHMRSVLLDTLADGAAAAAVAVAGGVIAFTHRFYWLDPRPRRGGAIAWKLRQPRYGERCRNGHFTDHLGRAERTE